jgi:hypothetical protein
LFLAAAIIASSFISSCPLASRANRCSSFFCFFSISFCSFCSFTLRSRSSLNGYRLGIPGSFFASVYHAIVSLCTDSDNYRVPIRSKEDNGEN